MPSDKLTRSRAKGKGAGRGKPCFRFANPDRRDGALHWVPDDFPAVFGDSHLTLVDQLIFRLINARNDLEDPSRAQQARALIAGVQQAIGGFDADSTLARHELIVDVLDASERLVTAPAYNESGPVADSPFADLELDAKDAT